MIERRFPKRVDALEGVFEFVREVFTSHGLPDDQVFEIDLILEELFTNMVRHAQDGHHPILIGIDWNGLDLTVILRDFDVERFDVTAKPRTDLTRPLRERTAGGLGLHFVQRLADGLQYNYADRTSTITVTKRLEI